MAGVAKYDGAEAAVGFPLESTAVTVMPYVVPGSKPAMGQLGDRHITRRGLPPVTGVAVTLNGPLVPGLG